MELLAVINVIRKNLPRRILVQLSLLLVTMAASGLAEVVSLGAIVPFLQAISNIEKFKQEILHFELLSSVDAISNNHLILVTAAVFIFAIIVSSGIRLLNLYLTNDTSAKIAHILSNRVYQLILAREYSEHISTHSSNDINLFTTHIKSTADYINALLLLCTAFLTSASISIAITIASPLLALLTASSVVLVYVILARSSKERLINNGKISSFNLNNQVKIIQESLGSIRDVIIDGSYPFFISKFSDYDWQIRKRSSSSTFLKMSPKFIVEPAALVAIVSMSSLLVVINQDSGNTLFTLGVIAIGLQKLLPSLQQFYNSWGSLKNYKVSVDLVCATLIKPIVIPNPSDACSKPLEKIALKLSDVSFKYANSSSESLKKVNLTFGEGEIIGIIGTTGSGKSTLFDILMGLLEPTSGQITINGANLHDKKDSALSDSWRKSIAHVPQDIYLTDASIEENIAFGIPLNNIDNKRVRWSASQAALKQFIESLPLAYATTLGERGSQLSGGQRQRIGIARAFYKHSLVLFLDEATSALDNNTEEQIIASIKNSENISLVIMIAHRLASLKDCTRIIEMKDGRVVNDGLPDSVI